MEGKEIKLLRQQIDKLDAKDFDLETWKKYTIIILARIFGETNEKIRQIEKLEFRFSSWSLRDASGNESYEEGTKQLAREILQAAIDEIDAFGLPEKQIKPPDETIQEFLSLLLDELKGSQVKQLRSILLSGESREEKERQIREILEGLGEFASYDILTRMLLHKTSIQIIGKT